MPIKLTPAQIDEAVAVDNSRGLIPKQVTRAVTSGAMFIDLNEVPALVAKFTEDGEFDHGKLRSQVAAAIKTQRTKVLAEGGSFPELEAARVTDDSDGSVHVVIADMEKVRAAEKAAQTNGGSEL